MKTAFLLIAALCTFPDTGQVAPPRAPDMWVFCIRGCHPCQRAKVVSQTDTTFDWHVLQVGRFPQDVPEPQWITDTLNKNPERKPEDAEGYPFFVWRDKNGKVVYASGFTDLKTLTARWRASR